MIHITAISEIWVLMIKLKDNLLKFLHLLVELIPPLSVYVVPHQRLLYVFLKFDDSLLQAILDCKQHVHAGYSVILQMAKRVMLGQLIVESLLVYPVLVVCIGEDEVD